MEAHAETASKAIAQAENALRAILDQKEIDHAIFESLLDPLRKCTQDYIFLKITTPAARQAEDRLWEWHTRVNRRFQKNLRQNREGAVRKKHVERRKGENNYLVFIKSSIHFYRAFIQHLASSFPQIIQIGAIAQQLHLSTLSTEMLVPINDAQKDSILLSLFSSLMRIGDLSRYKETELEHKQRNWGPAKGHYLLALSVRPESGAVFNQLAVMALADEDHLRAVYNLHRSATALKIFSISRENIRVEFRKILEQEPEEKSAISDTSRSAVDVLENRFLNFHANCNLHPDNFILFSDKAEQMLQLLTIGLEETKDRSLDKLIQKMVLINIAAEHIAQQGTSLEYLRSQHPQLDDSVLLQEHQRNCQAVLLYQRFNIMTFSTLLRILARELGSDDANGSNTEFQYPRPVTTPVARLLPHLRHYSSWLLSNVSTLLNLRLPSSERALQQLWQLYVKALNLLIKNFIITDLPSVSYLLDEDEDSLGFAPFSEIARIWRFHLDEGGPRPKFRDTSTERSADVENRSRVKSLVFDAGRFTIFKKELGISWSPVLFVDKEFVLQNKPIETELPQYLQAKPSTPFRSRAHQSTTSVDGLSAASTPKLISEFPNGKIPDSIQAAQTIPVAGDRDRNELNAASALPAKGTDSSLPPIKVATAARSPQFSTPTEHSVHARPVSASYNVMDLVRGMSRTPGNPQSPQLPTSTMSRPDSIFGNATFSSPFTPLPHESGVFKSRPSTASGQNISSSVFQRDLLQQQRDIDLRTSPQQAVNFSSWSSPQPASPIKCVQPSLSSTTHDPWQISAPRSPRRPQRQLPQAALFGAIGEPRRPDTQTPTPN